MDLELTNRLERCKDLPSPPGVAVRIIALSNDPDSDMDQFAKVLATDPALTTKIVRIANSPIYASSRPTESLRQALVLLGLNATMSLALSFSLLRSWQDQHGAAGIDYLLFWRRALLAATTAQIMANTAGLKEAEEIFLSTLIQDVGILALDRALPDLYKELDENQLRHDVLIRYERERLGTDHAEVGGWLLDRWNFPPRIQQAVAHSHDLEQIDPDASWSRSARCIAVANLAAEVMIDTSGDRRFNALAAAAEAELGMDKAALGDVLAQVAAVVPDAEMVFQTELLGSATESILEEAREALMLRNLRALQAVDQLRDEVDSLEQRTRQLDETSRRDPLTGLFNRSHLDQFLEEAFREANATNTPLSLAFGDLDCFKEINDTFGHSAGDQILVTTARILRGSVRATDVVARYGGEEFVFVFPGSDDHAASLACNRIVEALQTTQHVIAPHRNVGVTLSIGIATHNDGRRFERASDLLRAADKALYTAKLQGKNRFVPYELIA